MKNSTHDALELYYSYGSKIRLLSSSEVHEDFELACKIARRVVTDKGHGPEQFDFLISSDGMFTQLVCVEEDIEFSFLIKDSYLNLVISDGVDTTFINIPIKYYMQHKPLNNFRKILPEKLDKYRKEGKRPLFTRKAGYVIVDGEYVSPLELKAISKELKELLTYSEANAYTPIWSFKSSRTENSLEVTAEYKNLFCGISIQNNRTKVISFEGKNKVFEKEIYLKKQENV